MVPQRLTCTILCMFQIHGGVTKMWQAWHGHQPTRLFLSCNLYLFFHAAMGAAAFLDALSPFWSDNPRWIAFSSREKHVDPWHFSQCGSKKVECSDANVWDLQGKVWLRRTSHGTFFDSDGWCGVFSQTFLDFSLASPWEQMSCATSGRKLNLCSPFVSKQLDQLGILLISISSFTWLALTKGPKCQGEDLDLASFEKALELILLREGFLRSN